MDSSTQRSKTTSQNSSASALPRQAKAPSRTSKWGMILIILVLSTFLGIYGYGSFNSKARQNAVENQSETADAASTSNFMANYVFSSNNNPSPNILQNNAEGQPAFLFDLLEEDTEAEPVPAPKVVQDQSFPESYEQYVQTYEKTSQETAPATQQPQVDPMEQMAFNFAQQLQQKRYNDMLQSLDAPSTVPNQAKFSKENLRNLGTQPQGIQGTQNTYGYSPAKQQLIAQNNPYTQQIAYTNQGAQGATAYDATLYSGSVYGGMGQNISQSMGQEAIGYGYRQSNNYNATGISATQTLQAYQGLVNPHTNLNPQIEPVLSPFLLRQGVVIPCVLLTGINSDLPGFIQAQVSQDVYDSPLGQHLLIPQGSRIVGQYAAAPKMGQQRLMLAFNRVIFPDGKAMSLGAMPGSSLDGYSGFEAEVDNHFWQLMSNAILLGGITAGISISVDEPRDDNGNLTLNGALSQSMGQSIGRVLTEVIERNLVVSPTLKVQPGLEFNVTLIQDIYFPGPYHDDR